MQQVNQQGTTRRTMLRAGAAAGTATALGAVGLLSAGRAGAATATAAGGNLPYPPGVTDASHAAPAVAEVFRGVFTAKSEHNLAAFMSYFSTANAVYIDACLGVALSGWQAISTEFTGLFASAPASAVSYPLRIVGGTRSAVVELVDTPGFFGQELRSLSSVTFDGQGKITRWVDYWDGRSSLWPNTIPSAYPGFSDAEQNADPAVVQAAAELQAAFGAGDAAAAAALLSADVVCEDMAAHTRVEGQIQARRYYARALGQLPYGPGAALAHVEGSAQGGGYEWSAAPAAAPMRRGHTALELNPAGQISRVTAMYDSSLLSYPAYQSLVGLAAEAPLS